MLAQPAFRALADPTRREILCLLGAGEKSVAQVAGHFTMTRAAVKKHLTILEQGDLIRMRREGRETLNALNPEGMAPVRDWLAYFDSFWDARLEALKSAIETEGKTDD